VQVNNLPAARLGDPASCGQTISGAYSANVFINGKNAATLGSTLSHGGVIIGGSGDVLIGDTVVTADFCTPTPLEIGKWIINPAIKHPKSSRISDARMPEISTDSLGA
jgi:hypothetical protein